MRHASDQRPQFPKEGQAEFMRSSPTMPRLLQRNKVVKPKSERCGIDASQRPLQRGGRFSKKAVIPSRKSSLI